MDISDIRDIRDIRDTATLITGGSQGLGRALGRTLAAAGSRVVLVARHQEALDDAVAEIRAQGGVAFGIAADIGDKHAIHAIAGEAAALVGPIDIAINNASTLGPTPLRLLSDTECEDLQRVLEVNVVGPFRLTKVLAGSMAVRGRGLIINISSDAATEAYPTWGAYGASKAALDHLGRIWAQELDGSGVCIVSVDPGEMDTAMHAAAMPDADRSTLAAPGDVAADIAAIIRGVDTVPSGSRIAASEGRVQR